MFVASNLLFLLSESGLIVEYVVHIFFICPFAVWRCASYEVRVGEADQADRPPQVFTHVRIYHVVTGFEIDSAAIEQAIDSQRKKYCSVGAMVKQTASLETTYEIER